MNTRVVVTGMGAITPIGNSVEAFWTAVKSNTVGIAPITHFDTADFKCKLAAEVKDFDPKQYMDPKTARRMETFCQFAVAAAGCTGTCSRSRGTGSGRTGWRSS